MQRYKVNNSQSKPESQKQYVTTRANPTTKVSKVQPVSDTLSSVQEVNAVQIGVTLKASSWIRVVADGKTEFEGTYRRELIAHGKLREQLTVKTDNAGGVLMSVNQQKAKQMGEPGKVEEINIAAKPKF